MRVLIGCEESQAVCKAFRELGIEAYSCDIKPCSGGHPEWHFQIDVFKAIGLKNWDLIILHPPCTAIAVSGNGTYGTGKHKSHMRQEGVDFAQKCWNYAKSVCNHVVLENPVGVLNRLGDFPKPQYIQPWQFGHGETKKTGLWLYGLPKLIPTDIVSGREPKIHYMSPGPERSTLRSKTYPGIAKAMAIQWSEYIKNKTKCE